VLRLTIVVCEAKRLHVGKAFFVFGVGLFIFVFFFFFFELFLLAVVDEIFESLSKYFLQVDCLKSVGLNQELDQSGFA
jgi:hypothetical protein